MNELIIVQNVRGRLLPDGSAELHLEDVARGLGFVQVKNGVEYVRWERINRYLTEMGFPHLVGKEFIPENVFYRLAMKGETESALQFQILVADEILPSIRKHGAYLTPEKIEEVLSDPDTIIRLATTLKEEQQRRIEAEKQIEANRPKVLFAEAVEVSATTILIRELATILKQNGIEIGEKRLFEELRQRGFLIKRLGSDRNMPTQKSMELGLFEIKETPILHNSGKSTVSKTPKVTGKGQVYFVNLFKRDFENKATVVTVE